MDLLLIVLYFLFVCTALGYIYFHFFNMSETSRRIRILYEIRNNGSLLQNKIALPYNESDIIQARLKRLTDMGQLRFDGKYYYLNGTLLYWAARVVHIWRKIIFLA